MKLLVLYDPESGDVETEHLAIAKIVGPFPDEAAAKAWREQHAPWPESEYDIRDLVAPAGSDGAKAFIEVPLEQWHVQNDDSGKPEFMVTWIDVNGVQMHLEAHRRGRIDKDGAYVDNDALEKIAQGVEPDGAFSTLRYKGRKFVLVATPFTE